MQKVLNELIVLVSNSRLVADISEGYSSYASATIDINEHFQIKVTIRDKRWSVFIKLLNCRVHDMYQNDQTIIEGYDVSGGSKFNDLCLVAKKIKAAIDKILLDEHVITKIITNHIRRENLGNEILSKAEELNRATKGYYLDNIQPRPDTGNVYINIRGLNVSIEQLADVITYLNSVAK